MRTCSFPTPEGSHRWLSLPRSFRLLGTCGSTAPCPLPPPGHEEPCGVSSSLVPPACSSLSLLKAQPGISATSRKWLWSPERQNQKSSLNVCQPMGSSPWVTSGCCIWDELGVLGRSVGLRFGATAGCCRNKKVGSALQVNAPHPGTLHHAVPPGGGLQPPAAAGDGHSSAALRRACGIDPRSV